MPSRLPDWFKVGAECFFRGFGSIYKVVSIDADNGSWVADYYGGQGRFPLDEVVEKHWWEPAFLINGGIDALIHWRAGLIDSYGPELADRVQYSLSTWRPGMAPELPAEHEAAMEAFQKLPEDVQYERVCRVTEE